MRSLRLSRPHAIMMVGLPNSGKTFFATQFAKTFNAPYIDSLIIEEGAKDATSAGAITAMIINEIAKTSQTFVFEGNSDSRVRRSEFARWARTQGYQPLFIWVQVDHATSRDRTARAKNVNPENFERMVRGFSAPHPDEQAVVISGKHTYATQAKVVLHHLSKENRTSIDQHDESQPTALNHRPRPAGRSITIR